MSITDTAEAAHRAASAVMYTGAGMAAGSGASIGVTTYFGLTLGHWQVIGIVAGIVFAAAGYFTNLWFKHAHYRLEVRKSLGDPPEE
jgi:hypothetical protein